MKATLNLHAILNPKAKKWLALLMVLALLTGMVPFSGMAPLTSSAVADPFIGTKLADKLFAKDSFGVDVFSQREMSMLVETVKLFMDVDDGLNMCNTLNTALVAMMPSGQAGVFLDNGVSFFTAYAIAQYIENNETYLTYANLENYTGIKDGMRDRAAFEAAINARADTFWSYLQNAGKYNTESFENGLTKMDRVFHFLQMLTVVYPEMFIWSHHDKTMETPAKLKYVSAGSLILDRTRTAKLLYLANTQLTHKIDMSPTSSAYDAINQLTVYYNASSASATASGTSDREYLFNYLNTYRYLRETSAVTPPPGGGGGGGGGNTGGGNAGGVGNGNNPGEEIIADENIAQASGAFKVVTTVKDGVSDSIFRMADWNAIKDLVVVKGVILDGSSTRNVNLCTFGIEYNVLLAMEAAKIRKLSLMTDAGIVSYPLDAFKGLITTFLAGKSAEVANTAVLYFDMKKLTALEAFPFGMSAKQKLAYQAGNLVYGSTLRTSVVEGGKETVQTVPSSTRFDRQVVLSWPYAPNNGVDTDKLTAWYLSEDGSVSNAGGRFNIGSGMFQTLVNHFSINTIATTKVIYKDVTAHWSTGNINRLSSMDVTSGNAGNFRPDAKLTRAEFAKMIVLAKKLDTTLETSKFADIKNGDWHNVYVAAAVADGFINGNADGTFAPSRAITRQEMAVMIQKALDDNTLVGDFEALTFEDKAKIADYARASVAIVTDLGIMNGKSGLAADPFAMVFDPAGSATRGEAAAVVYRFLDYLLSE